MIGWTSYTGNVTQISLEQFLPHFNLLVCSMLILPERHTYSEQCKFITWQDMAITLIVNWEASCYSKSLIAKKLMSIK